MGWGISKLVGAKATVDLLVFAYLRIHVGLTMAASTPFLYSSLVLFLVSLASHPSIDLPLLLGKRPDGSFPIWSLLAFGLPYLYSVRMLAALRRFLSGEPPYSEICEGVYVGGWPSSPQSLPPGDPAVVDCTCEFPNFLPRNPYLCIPTWDTRAPPPPQIQSAVKWACAKRAQTRPVFIHCAYGHGRSVAVMCALLVTLGVAEDWKSAEKLIYQKRPYIRMNDLQRKALEEWSKLCLSATKRNEEVDVSSVILSSAPGVGLHLSKQDGTR